MKENRGVPGSARITRETSRASRQDASESAHFQSGTCPPGLFYSETLGLAFEVVDVEGGYRVARLPGDVFLRGEASPAATPQVVFGLAKGGIDGMVASLAAAGVELVTGVTEAPGGWSAELKDPEGHILSLYQEGALPR